MADPRGEAERYLEAAVRSAVRDVAYYGAVHRPGIPLPILERRMLRARGEAFVSARHRALGPLRIVAPADATGEPIRFLQDREQDRFTGYALDYWYREIIGIDPVGLRTFVIWGSSGGLVTWTAGGRRRRACGTGLETMRPVRVDGGTFAECLSAIDAAKPDVIRGFGDTLSALATRLRTADAVHRPLFLVGSAGTIARAAREEIQDALDRPLYALYEAGECPVIAGECRLGRLHVFHFHHHVEVVGPDGDAVSEGGEGRLLVSQLHNAVMPLLRYEIGDAGIVGPATCGCGAPQPTLLDVRRGTSDPFVVLEAGSGGAEVLPRLLALGDVARALRADVEPPGDVHLRLVTRRGVTVTPAREREIRRTLRAGAAKGGRLRIEPVRELPRSPGERLFGAWKGRRGGSER